MKAGCVVVQEQVWCFSLSDNVRLCPGKKDDGDTEEDDATPETDEDTDERKTRTSKQGHNRQESGGENEDSGEVEVTYEIEDADGDTVERIQNIILGENCT